MSGEPGACRENFIAADVRRSKESIMKATQQKGYPNGMLEVEQLFRRDKRTGRGLSLTIRENGPCKENISSKWCAESRACFTVNHLPIIHIKAVAGDELSLAREILECHDGGMPKA